MSQFEFTSCRLAIQICIGHFPDGRERHRTFSIKNIRPDADDAALLAVVRAVGALLAYPVTKARLIVKKRRVLFDAKTGMGTKESAAPETRAGARERGMKPRVAGERIKSVIAKSAELAKITAHRCMFVLARRKIALIGWHKRPESDQTIACYGYKAARKNEPRCSLKTCLFIKIH
jgi:hypothetical protein